MMKKYLIIISLAIVSTSSYGQVEKYKALYMYKFIQSIEWPNTAANTYKIAVLNDSKVLENLKTLTDGRLVKGKKIEVIDYTPGTSLTGIHMLFLSHSKRDLFESLYKESAQSATVLVAETPGLGADGAFFNFITQQGKLKFEINETSFATANVKVGGAISSLGIKVD